VYRQGGRKGSEVNVVPVLDEIVAHKRTEVAAAKAECPLAELERQLDGASPVRHFADALATDNEMRLIAEIKKASPSAGLIREDFDPVTIAQTYANHGASCLSVLTDERFFQGQLEFLTAVRDAVTLPVLRKDFLIDPYQIVEARVAGADCVLLIAECLTETELADLYARTIELGMDALIEIYEPGNLDRVLALKPRLLGINNRNLKTMTTSLSHTLDLIDRVPDDVLLVSESGIRTHEDVVRLHSAGVQAMLVGESLMRADDIGQQVDDLLGRDLNTN
jgi:indole-3-glycerol phosphate synthase